MCERAESVGNVMQERNTIEKSSQTPQQDFVCEIQERVALTIAQGRGGSTNAILQEILRVADVKVGVKVCRSALVNPVSIITLLI
jgi:hypothetical protein